MKLFGLSILTTKQINKAQRAAKHDAYQQVYQWAKSNNDLVYGSTGWFAEQKMDGHHKFLYGKRK